MYFITVFFLMLMHVNLAVSKGILYNRRNMDATQTSPSAGTNYETENPNLQRSSATQEYDATQMSPNLIDSTEPIGLIRRLDPSELLHTKQVAKKQAARQHYEEDQVATSMRTTSEGKLQWLLKKKLPFPDPAPLQVGQSEIAIMFPFTEPIWRFEAYDDSKSYDERVRDSNSDCEGQRIRCIDDTEYNQPVCVNDNSIPIRIPAQARMKGFASACEVEYRNCIKRFEITGKYYADHYSEDYLEFLHYGWCTQCGTVAYCYG